jgi:hypothetical protein
MNQLLTRVVIKIAKDMDIPSWTCGETYESIVFPEGYTKPLKEEFEALMKVERWKDLRAKRNKLLTNCDWTQLPNIPLSGAVKYEWETYRQALRDLPRTTEDPDNLVLPTPPH